MSSIARIILKIFSLGPLVPVTDCTISSRFRLAALTRPRVLLKNCAEMVQFLRGKHLIDVQEDLDFAFDLRHAEEVSYAGLVAEIRRILNLLSGQVQHLRYAIHDNADHDRPILSLDLRDDDARALCVF